MSLAPTRDLIYSIHPLSRIHCYQSLFLPTEHYQKIKKIIYLDKSVVMHQLVGCVSRQQKNESTPGFYKDNIYDMIMMFE